MYTCCLLLAVLISSVFPSNARSQRDGARANSATIVERLRSELLDMLDDATIATEDSSLRSKTVEGSLTRLGGSPGAQPSFRRGSACWWLWLLFGPELCVTTAPNAASFRLQDILP